MTSMHQVEGECCDIGLIVKDCLLEFFPITIILFPSLEIFLC